MDSWVVEMQAKIKSHPSGGSQEEQLWRKKPSIYKVPSFIISRGTKKNYQPRVVSFGPYHHWNSLLKQMEADKERALLHFVGRSGRSMQQVFKVVEDMVPELKDSYESLGYEWQDNKKFAKMMILDWCFMLEVLQQYYSDDDPVFSRHGDIYILPFIKADMLLLENQLPMSLLLKLNDIQENVKDDKNVQPDKIEEFNKSILWLLNYSNRDGDYPIMGECLHVLDLYRKGLLLLGHDKQGDESSQSVRQGAPQSPDQGERKNEQGDESSQSQSQGAPQSPDHGERKNERLPGLRGWLPPPRRGRVIKRIIAEIFPSFFYSTKSSTSRTVAFFKDLCKNKRHAQRLAPPNIIKDTNIEIHTNTTISKKNNRVGHNVVRPTVELQEAGVRFRKSNVKSLRDIAFDSNSGILTLPIFIVDDYTKSTFLNLIAFERCHIPAGSHITSFVAFMDRIIDDSRDIKVLSSKGIINNFIGSDKEAANLFNTISTTRDLDVEMNDNLYEVYNKLTKYSNTAWNKWRANLKESYLRSPWAIVSIIAAFLIFSLTALQTIFTILN